jgi:hypothetical protein
MNSLKNLIFASCLGLLGTCSINSAYAWLGQPCIGHVTKATADQHIAGQPLKVTVGDLGKHNGEEAFVLLPSNKSFHEVTNGDLVYYHGVVHILKRTQKQPNGHYQIELQPTKLIINGKQPLK